MSTRAGAEPHVSRQRAACGSRAAGSPPLAYRDEVRGLAAWCQDNNLSLNICKTKEMIVDFRKLQRGGHNTIHIEGAAVERVSNFKFLGVYIKDDITWSMQADSAVKTAQKRLYFLRRPKKFGMSSKTLKNFIDAPLRASSQAASLPGMVAAPLPIARPCRGW